MTDGYKQITKELGSPGVYLRAAKLITEKTF